MGFGQLFIGYLLAFGFSSGANYILTLVGLVGCVFIYLASEKLSRYAKSFRYCKTTIVILGISYIVNIVLQTLVQYNLISGYSFVERLARVLIISSVFVFNSFMYRAVFEIAGTLDDKKLCKDAARDFVFMIAYYLAMSLTFLSPYISLLASILAVIWLVLSVWLTLSAYMRICLPGDEDMPEKKIPKK